jgi:hypothetical protein
MHDHHIRTRSWLADLEAITQELEVHGLPSPARKASRARKLKPLWEE